MRVLIFGGLGVLGQELAGLVQGEAVTIVDHADPRWSLVCEELGAGADYDYGQLIVNSGKWDLIYYLAEELALPYTQGRQLADACGSHISQLAHVISSAAITGSRIIVPVWREVSQSDLIGITISMKRTIIECFNRGNSRATVVELPLFLDGGYPESHRGSIVSRFLANHSECVRLFEEDFLDERDHQGFYHRDRYLERARSWCSVERAASYLWQLGLMPHRRDASLEGTRASLLEVFEVLMMVTGRRSQLIEFQRYEPVELEGEVTEVEGQDELRRILEASTQ